MSETYSLVDKEIDRLVAAEDLTVAAAAMFLMVNAAMAMASALPPGLRGALVTASSRWFAEPSPVGHPLAGLAAECWSYLEAKNGNSITVTDREDIAVRTLLCVLWDEAPDAEELNSTLDYFVSLVDQFDGIREALGLVE